MICETIIGSLRDAETHVRLSHELGSYTIEEVSFAWDECRRRVMRKTGSRGTDLGIRLDEASWRRGIRSGDVLGIDRGSGRVLVATIEPADALLVKVGEGDLVAAARFAWEVGNTHTPLFSVEGPDEFAAPFSEPLLQIVRTIPDVVARRGEAVLDPGRQLSVREGHHHHHHHDHDLLDGPLEVVGLVADDEDDAK